MRFVIAAGGTAGHINPAIALAEELHSRGHEIEFVGNPKGLEARLVPQAGFDFYELESSGFDRAHPQTLFKAFYNIARGSQILKKHFTATKPDALIGFGAYLELAAANAARALKIPVVIHEQNSVPGLANKLVARFASLIALSYPSTEAIFSSIRSKHSQMIVTGNPVRSSVLSSSREAGREAYKIPKDAFMLLVFGGSLGARHINQAMCKLKDKLLEQKNIYVVHSVGKLDYKQVVQDFDLSNDEQKHYIIKDYIDNMGDTLKAADLVVSRAGASSIAEISALAVPSILIPYPHATENHQQKNAQFLVESGAGLLLEDEKLEGDALDTLLFELIASPENREQMQKAALELSGEGAAYKLASAVESVVQK